MSPRAALAALAVLVGAALGGVPARAATSPAAPAAAVSSDAVSWARPVSGRVTRGFDLHGSPFAAGQHRGVDLWVAAGTSVRAPCAGTVVVAGRVGTAGRVVTVACGPWHASVLPLAHADVHRGAHVDAGDPVGAADASSQHRGVHLGVRRASERFGYVDPLRFLPSTRPWAPVGPRPSGRPRLRVGGRPSAAAHPALERGASPAAARGPVVHRGAVAAPRPGVPSWPVWAGAALLLAGASGELVQARRRPVSPVRTGLLRRGSALCRRLARM